MKKTFTLEESKFLNELMTQNGCVSENFECPHWNWNLTNEKNEKGDCSTKHSNKLCITLQLAADGVATLEARDRSEEDERTDVIGQLSKAREKIESIDNQIKELQKTRASEALKLQKLQKRMSGQED